MILVVNFEAEFVIYEKANMFYHLHTYPEGDRTHGKVGFFLLKSVFYNLSVSL